jgi:hypothetical protein
MIDNQTADLTLPTHEHDVTELKVILIMVYEDWTITAHHSSTWTHSDNIILHYLPRIPFNGGTSP